MFQRDEVTIDRERFLGSDRDSVPSALPRRKESRWDKPQAIWHSLSPMGYKPARLRMPTTDYDATKSCVPWGSIPRPDDGSRRYGGGNDQETSTMEDNWVARWWLPTAPRRNDDEIHEPPENDPDPYPMPRGLLAVSLRTETQNAIALMGQSL
jgi:hypothetical protein